MDIREGSYNVLDPNLSAELELQGQSRLLNLPAELREHIWSLALTCDQPQEGEIDFVFAIGNKPSDTLLRVSRQVRDETKTLYEVARSQYWRRKFRLTLPTTCGSGELSLLLKSVREVLSEISDEDVRAIPYLGLHSCGGFGPPCCFKFENGFWHAVTGVNSIRPPRCGMFGEVVLIEHNLMPKPCVLRIPIGSTTGFVFYEISNNEEKNAAHNAAGWDGLTKKEIEEAVRVYEEFCV